MPFSFSLISLGCPKNQVDSEEMFTRLKNAGMKYVSDEDCGGADPEKALSVCVINTCGFIEAARKESIGVIMEAIEKKREGKIKYIAVAGCMVNNNLRALKEELPEVDIFIPTFDESKIAEKIALLAGKKITGGKHKKNNTAEKFAREHFNLKRTAYLKISEGCGRLCSFCTIPYIRGKYKSKSIEEIKNEASYLAARGVRELIIVSQDTSCYGQDLNIKNGLYKLLKELVRIKEIEWLRLMYLYPLKALFTDDLIELMNNEEKIQRYIDMPVQHINDGILKLMKRGGTKKDITGLIERLKNKISGVALRTSLIAGFPGETDENFEELLEFVKDMKFDNLGVFKYSDEREAASFKYGGKVSPKTKNARYKILMKTQQDLLPQIFSKHIGKTYYSIIDGITNKTVKLRTYFQSPDIDGCVNLYLRDLKPGFEINSGRGFMPVKILKAKDYDLLGVPVESYLKP